jgi:putative solute:sodium symporter small subunit
MQQPRHPNPHHPRAHDAEMAGPFPPDLHDVRHLWLKAGLLVVWALVSFVATYFARDLQFLVAGGWPLGYWIAAQGAVLVFIALVVVYGWAMNRFERQDAERIAATAPGPEAVSPRSDGALPHG